LISLEKTTGGSGLFAHIRMPGDVPSRSVEPWGPDRGQDARVTRPGFRGFPLLTQLLLRRGQKRSPKLGTTFFCDKVVLVEGGNSTGLVLTFGKQGPFGTLCLFWGPQIRKIPPFPGGGW